MSMYDRLKWVYSLPISQTQSHLLMVLIGYADDAGVCYPTQATIAKNMKVSEKAVRNNLLALQKLTIIDRFKGDQGRASFRLNFSFCAEKIHVAKSQEAELGSQIAEELNSHKAELGSHKEEPNSTSEAELGSKKTELGSKKTELGSAHIDEQPITTNEQPLPPLPPNDNFTEPDLLAKCKTDQAVDEWNAMAKQNDIPKAMGMNPTRRKAMKARLADCQAMRVTWSEIVERVGDSDFLSGRSGDWRITGIDWALKPTNFTKIIEGAYDNRAQKSPRNLTDDDLWNANIAAAAGVQ